MMKPFYSIHHRDSSLVLLARNDISRDTIDVLTDLCLRRYQKRTLKGAATVLRIV